MPLVDVIDDTFVAVSPVKVAACVANPAVWRSWWPDLELTVGEDRGIEGIRWLVSGRLVGSAEVWIERYEEKGCLVHFFLRTDPAQRWRFGRDLRARRLARQYTMEWKRHIHALKDSLEAVSVGES